MKRLFLFCLGMLVLLAGCSTQNVNGETTPPTPDVQDDGLTYYQVPAEVVMPEDARAHLQAVDQQLKEDGSKGKPLMAYYDIHQDFLIALKPIWEIYEDESGFGTCFLVYEETDPSCFYINSGAMESDWLKEYHGGNLDETHSEKLQEAVDHYWAQQVASWQEMGYELEGEEETVIIRVGRYPGIMRSNEMKLKNGIPVQQDMMVWFTPERIYICMLQTTADNKELARWDVLHGLRYFSHYQGEEELATVMEEIERTDESEGWNWLP
ncbi:MAG: hypothetical protein E7328_01050 [Clostridiales bacterium]|nr:hypothetical protein [Clostridiales bacterium]